MSRYPYVLLDPTGNLTALVLAPVPPEDRPRVTAALMGISEQVGYLMTPTLPGAAARLEMMGGEFCGNATMATASWLMLQKGLPVGGETLVPMEVSGAKDVLSCRICRREKDFQGTVPMPAILDWGESLPAWPGVPYVRMEGILHWIWQGEFLPEDEATRLLREAAQRLSEEAAGLLFWDEKTSTMRPLIFVKPTSTMVWETGCGSGSAAIGAWRAVKQGDGETRTVVHQPGGTITAAAWVQAGRVERVEMTGTVRMGEIQTLALNE